MKREPDSNVGGRSRIVGVRHSHQSERGDTLVEVLLTLVVLGLTVVSLVLAFSTSISASAEHRNLAVSDTVLRSVTESVFSVFQQVANPVDTTCSQATGPLYTSQLNGRDPSPLAIPAPYTTQYQNSATVSSVGYWDMNSKSFSTSAPCFNGFPQQLAITVSGPGGSETADVVIPGSSQIYPVAVGPASQLVLSGCSSDIVVGATCTVTATLEDVNGYTVNSYIGSVSFSHTGSGSVTGLSNTAFVSGVASVTLTGNGVGQVSVNAVGDHFTSNTVSFTVTTPVASKLVLSGCSSNIASGATCTATATIEDASGNTVTTYTGSVTFAQTAGSGSVTGPSSAAFVSGVASVTLTGNRVGPVSIDAESPPFTSNTVSFTVTPRATQVAFTLVPPPGTSSSFTVVVAVEDAAGNTVTADNSSQVTLLKTSGTGSFSGCTSPLRVTDGVATFTGCHWSNSGTKGLRATSGALTPDNVTFPLT